MGRTNLTVVFYSPTRQLHPGRATAQFRLYRTGSSDPLVTDVRDIRISEE